MRRYRAVTVRHEVITGTAARFELHLGPGLRAPARMYLTLRNPNPKSAITCTTTYRRVQITHLMRMRHALGTVIDIQH